MKTLPFIYAVNTASIAASGQGTAIIQINQDSNFECHHIEVVTSIDAETDIRPNNVSLLINDAANGRDLMNIAIQQALLDRLIPLRQYRAVQMIAGTNYNITVNNLNTLSALTAQIAFVGYKVFPGA